jgi:ABC-type phosphate/phosphonate transport system substrate-binding protein
MTVANLPMYDLPEVEAATDTWWKGLARAFRREGISDVPDQLWRGASYRELWTRPDLLLSQTCGYPLVHGLRGKVTLVATPCYSAPGCSGPNYRSVVIVHRDSNARDGSELRGRKCAINNRDSQSGYNALRALIAPIASGKQFFTEVTISGSHLNSVRMVSEREADVAAIDCVTHALLARYRPQAIAGIRSLCLTPSAPALPYITRRNIEHDLVARLQNGLQAACHDPSLSESRESLMLQGFCNLSIAEYERLVQMERDAINRGYQDVA